MALSQAILAALLEQSCSGYDLAKRFDGAAGFFWHASHQQIYRELAKLEANGYLTAEYVTQDGRPNKKLYAITPEGQSALQDWIAEPTDMSGLKEDILIKLLAGHLVPKEVLFQELQRHYRLHKANLERYQSQVQSYIQSGQTGRTLSEAQKCHYATLRAGIHYENAQLAWCEEVTQILELR
jgi:DNA-binding PadR family transcriptional regulator